MISTVKKRVILTQRIFSSYRKPIFDLINERMQFTVLHGSNNSGIKTADAPYSTSIPSFQYWKKNETAVIQFPLLKILRSRPEVVIFELALGVLNLPVTILICKMMKIKTAFWSHGYNRKTGFHPERSWADRYRLFLLRLVDANIVYSRADRAVLGKYLDPESIFVAQNTLDTRPLIVIRDRLTREGKENVKKRLGIHHAVNIAFIGRMLREKSPDLLLEIYTILREEYGLKVGIHFIGDGEMLPEIRERVRSGLPAADFYFHGAIHEDEKSGALLFASDLMVMPTHLGLAVNHALCFDCPVAAFKTVDGYPTHFPEVEYVLPGRTGFLLPEHSPQAMARVIHDFIADGQLQRTMAAHIRNMVKNGFPPEKMVAGVVDCVEYVTSSKESQLSSLNQQ